MRDGAELSATLYRPARDCGPLPVVLMLTPYVAQRYHGLGIYFAERGYSFLCVDVRGRGNSDGTFAPFKTEATDGPEIVEWIARQRFCDGQVAMRGSSYGGFAQWATARSAPAPLKAIAPVASPRLGVDFPMRSGIASPYLMQWLTLVAGRTAQDLIFWDNRPFWGAIFRDWFETGASFESLGDFVEWQSPIFAEWLAHPVPGPHWDSLNPSQEDYARIDIPVLTITGIYDGDQPGALSHYRAHLRANPNAVKHHYLIIGPWDHAGTAAPAREFCGLTVGPQSLLDVRELHVAWFDWTMKNGPRPAFLRKPVAYYVMEADEWRYADTLDAALNAPVPFHLAHSGSAGDVFASGRLGRESGGNQSPISYVYDPADIGDAALEVSIDPESRTDDRLVHARSGKQFVFHSEPMIDDVEIIGFFSLSIWLSIDQPDTDFRAAVYEIDDRGRSVLLADDRMRARYREGPRAEQLIETTNPLNYVFSGFTFIARRISKGRRLRLVLGPINSIWFEKNYNSGGVVSRETRADGRPVKVTLISDSARPNILSVPLSSAVGPTPASAAAAKSVK